MPVVRKPRPMSPPPNMTLLGPLMMGQGTMPMGQGTMPMGQPVQLAPGPMGMPPTSISPVPMMAPGYMNGPPGAPQPPPQFITMAAPQFAPAPQPQYAPAPQPQYAPPPTQEPQQDQEPMSIKGKHIPLARCRVLYLGSAVPMETVEGLEAVQQPLKERYPISGDGQAQGIDCWLTVFSSGVSMQYVTDMNTVTWFPISTMHVSAATKCVVNTNSAGERIGRFVALDSREAEGSDHPPMFAAIMRRTKGVKVLECHTFVCKTSNAAMALVQSCTHAYKHKEGWNEGAAPPIDTLKSSSEQMHLVPAEKNEIRESKNVAKEFFAPPPENGYFYTTKQDVIKNYNIHGQGGGSDGGGRRAASEYEPRGPPPGGPPPGAPMMMAPQPMFMPGPGSMMMPPAPAGYFADWGRDRENFVHFPNLQHFVMPPGDPRMMEPIYPDPGYTRNRKKKPTKGHKNKGKKGRALSPRGQHGQRHRRRSPSPHYYSDESYTDDEFDHDRYYRSRGPPPAYPRRVGPPPRREDYYDAHDFPRGYYTDRELTNGEETARTDTVCTEMIRPVVAPVMGDRGNPYYAAELNRLNRDERPRGRSGRGGDQQSDLIMYGDRYVTDDYPLFQAARPQARRRTGSQERYVEYDSHFTKDIWMRDGNNLRRERERGRSPSPRAQRRADDYRSEYRDLEDFRDERRDEYRRDDYRRAPPPEERRYPRSDREFGQSIAEERRQVGDVVDYPDPYKMNYDRNYRTHIGDDESDYGYQGRIDNGRAPRDADDYREDRMRDGRFDLEDQLGYLP